MVMFTDDTGCYHGNIACQQSALHLLQSPVGVAYLRMLTMIAVVTENTGLLLTGTQHSFMASPVSL